MSIGLGQLGLTPDEFWDMSPYLFNRKLDGYFHHKNSAALHFRQLFALLYNVNRGEKEEPIDGRDVLTLYGEKKPRKARVPRSSILKMSPDALADFLSRINKN